MTEPEALVAAAAIGGLAALAGALVAGGTALRNETRRRSAGRKDVERQALRTQAAEVFRHIFALQHEMEWLTWHAVNRPKVTGQVQEMLCAARWCDRFEREVSGSVPDFCLTSEGSLLPCLPSRA